MPEQLLQQLVRNPGEAVIGAVRQSISAVQDQIQRAEERVVRPDVALEEALEKTLARTLRGLKIPSEKDMQRFDRRLVELAKRVDRLAAAIEPSSARSASKPATARKRRPPRAQTS